MTEVAPSPSAEMRHDRPRQGAQPFFHQHRLFAKRPKRPVPVGEDLAVDLDLSRQIFDPFRICRRRGYTLARRNARCCRPRQ